MSIVCETNRLIIREFRFEDADFIIQLLNDMSFIRNIGDKGVRTHKDAIAYLRTGPMHSYQLNGFGLGLIRLKGLNTAIGMCGLLKRPELAHPDLGYALLPAYCKKGYAFEASESVLKSTIRKQALSTVLGVTLPENVSSNCLLLKLGFRFKQSIELYDSINNLYEYQAPKIMC